MAGGTSPRILSLYKTMLRESQKFVDKNYRSYAIRRVRDGFKEGAKETDEAKVQANIIKRCIKICVDHEIIKLADIDFINVFIL